CREPVKTDHSPVVAFFPHGHYGPLTAPSRSGPLATQYCECAKWTMASGRRYKCRLADNDRNGSDSENLWTEHIKSASSPKSGHEAGNHGRSALGQKATCANRAPHWSSRLFTCVPPRHRSSD